MMVASSRRALWAVIAMIAALLMLSACATGAPQESSSPTAAGPSSSEASSSAPPTSEPPSSSSPAPAPETTTAEPTTPAPATTSEAPAVDQPTVVYTKAAATVNLGEAVKVTITVQTPNPGVPFGDVTLMVDGAPYASATLNEAGNMSFTLKNLSEGDHTYQGVYAGNATYVASKSNTKTIHVLTAAEIEASQKKKEEQAAAAADNPCPANAKACVDLTNNTTWLQSNGTVTAGPYKHIAGRQGHRTPTGMFTVQWKNKDHKSQEFNQAPMPYAIFFTNTGVAFHVGSLSNPSHGCIHLSESAAKMYWDALKPGDRVYVFGSAQY